MTIGGRAFLLAREDDTSKTAEWLVEAILLLPLPLLPPLTGGYPTIDLPDERMINIVIDINWIKRRYWRHVAADSKV